VAEEPCQLGAHLTEMVKHVFEDAIKARLEAR
jgi:hypothetical protein